MLEREPLERLGELYEVELDEVERPLGDLDSALELMIARRGLCVIPVFMWLLSEA